MVNLGSGGSDLDIFYTFFDSLYSKVRSSMFEVRFGFGRGSVPLLAGKPRLFEMIRFCPLERNFEPLPKPNFEPY